MPRKFTPKVITSNHLLEGDAIYLDADGNWVRKFEDARVFSNQGEANTVLSEADAQRNIHVGAYLADALIGEDGVPTPKHYREKFRRVGPSNYFHGKQAEL